MNGATGIQSTRWVWLAAVFAVCGCGDDESQRELDFAGQVVATALDAWKRGESADSLLSHETPIEFHDDDWQLAARLVDYTIVQVYRDTDGGPRCAVTLTLQRGQAPPEQIQETYQVNTNPKVVVARDPMS